MTKELKSFIITAQVGSFQKAGQQLFVSSTALIKQINALEDEVGVPLFYRTNKGVSLTDAGKIFYEAACDILLRYNNAITAARDSMEYNVNPIRFGFSQINPHHSFHNTDICKLFSNKFTPIIVPISSEYKDFTDELRNLGTNVDFIPYFLGHEGLDSVCCTFCLVKLPLCIATPIGHPLYDREFLQYEDLNGYDLLSIKSDVNRFYKEFNDAIRSRAPEVNIHYSNYYDFNILNHAVSSKQLILTGAYLRNAHPLFKLIPLKEEHYLPYGLHYSPNPAPAVIELLDSFRKAGISGSVEDAQIFDA